MRKTWLLVAAPLLTLVAVFTAFAQQPTSGYEQATTYQPAQVLPKELVRGPHYQTLNPVTSDGYMYRMSVRSDYGPFEVTGTGALRKLAREIAAIAQLREIKATKAFTSAVVDSASGPLAFTKNLIMHPVDTVSGVPKGAYKFMEDTAEAVSSERNPSDDPMYKKVSLMAGRKREYAAKYGVDVYSSNPVLQKELNAVGWAAAAGNLAVSGALMPVGGTAGIALAATRWSKAFDDYVNTEPAARLRIISQEKLASAGIAEDLAVRFVDQKSYTPRQHLVIAESLARLGAGPARGRDTFLQAALNAQDEVETTFFVNSAQILRGYHEAVSPLTEVRMDGRIGSARANNGTVVIALPIDQILWTPAVEQRVQKMKTAMGQGKIEAWMTGTSSPLARRQLGERGIVVVDRVGQRLEIVD